MTTRAEQIAHHESELRRLKAEEAAERGLVEGDKCWVALPTKGTVAEGIYYPDCNLYLFPKTDDGKRKADRAGKLFSSLNLEDPPFEVGQEVWLVASHGNVVPVGWDGYTWVSEWHQGRIKATEAEAVAWRDKFNSSWTGGME